jgi:MYXO-CTERM domain-containing protein
LLGSGDVLIAGGFVAMGYILASAEIYSPAAGAFAATFPMSYERLDHTATLLGSGEVLVAGGNWTHTSGGALSSAEVFETSGGPRGKIGVFVASGSLATPRYNHTATLLGGGTVLLAGGYNGKVLSTAELYDPLGSPAAGTFATAGSMTTARQDHSATLLGTGEVLVAGGFDDIPLSSAELHAADAGAGTDGGKADAGCSIVTVNDAQAMVCGCSTVTVNGVVAQSCDGTVTVTTTGGGCSVAPASSRSPVLPGFTALIGLFLVGFVRRRARAASVSIPSGS